MTNPASNGNTENYFAGMQLYEAGTEHLGICNIWDAHAYSAFNTAALNKDFNSSNPESGESYQHVRSTATAISCKIKFSNHTLCLWREAIPGRRVVWVSTRPPNLLAPPSTRVQTNGVSWPHRSH
ncbi:MAG: hypothetical protein KDN05_13090 [Verrucomicrobiae bacterium]|nr:hypothetical protein [Verrucomicrobiae bacterium]